MGGDFLLYILGQVIEAIYYTGSSGLKISIELSVFLSLICSVVILLLLKRAKQCVVGGFIYLILGILLWLFKLVYICYMIFTDLIYDYFEENYSEKNIYFIVFLLDLFTIFLRIPACYFVKKLYYDVCKLEEYIHEKEHAQFLESLGSSIGGEGLLNEEEITEEQLYQRKTKFDARGNPIKNKDEIEENEEEIRFQTIL